MQVNRMRGGRQFGQMIGPGTTSIDELPTVCSGIALPILRLTIQRLSL